MSFNTDIQQISTEDLDKLFESTPPGTPGAGDLATGTQSSEELEGTSSVQIGTAQIDYIDPNDIPNADGSTPELTDEQKATAEAAKAEADKAAAEAKANEGKTPEQIAEEKAAAEKKEEEEGAKPDTASVNEVLKNTVDYLVTSGVWADFDGREDLEMTEEVYAELAVKQNQAAAYEMVNEIVDSTGIYGKAIISHIKNGGNPDEVIDIFKAQKELEQIDTSTETGKQVLIEKYYKEILGWKPDKVSKTIKRVVEDNEIDAEFTDAKEAYDRHYTEQLQRTEQEAKAAKAEVARKQEQFISTIKETINSNTNLTAKEKAVIASSALDFKHKLDNGQKVNDFYLKFAEVQADPKSYVELVQFVMDMEGYKKKIKSQEETKANTKAFTFIKGNKAVAKPANAAVDIAESRENTPRGTDFSLALKR